VWKDCTSIGQDDAYVGVKSHTMVLESSSSRHPKSTNGDESWWSPKFATVCRVSGDCDTSSSSNTPTRCILQPSALTPCISKDLFSTSPFSIQAISRLSWSGLHTQTNSPKEEHHQKPDSKSSSRLFAVWHCQPTQEKNCIAKRTPYFSGLRCVSMPLHYLLRLQTLLFEGFVSSFHGFALSAAAAHLAF
jgi:hypothetical protein